MNVPGPRTNPTVLNPTVPNPSVTQALKSRRSLRHWEVRLGLPQLVVLVGFVTGSMVFSFYLGLTSGQTIGFETALERSGAGLPRLPVPGASPEGSLPQDDAAFDVYAKLNAPLPGEPGDSDGRKLEPSGAAGRGMTGGAPLDPGAVFGSAGAAPQVGTVPELGSIKSVGAAPLLEPETERSLAARIAPEQVSEVAPVAGATERVESPSPPVEAAVKKVETAKVAEANKKPEIAEKPAVKPTDSTASLVRRSLGKGWYAQVAAAPSLTEAEGLARKLKESGFPVLIETTKVQGTAYYRIVVGPETSRQQAQILVNQLKREPYIKEDPFLRTVP